LLHRQGDNAAAAEHFAVVHQATNDPACGNNLASVLERHDQVPEAIDLLQDLVQVRPDCKLAWNTLGGMLVRCKRYMKARDTLVQALISTMN